MMLSLSNYPRVIEPTVEVIELDCGPGDARPRQFERLDTVTIHQMVALPQPVVHLFGDSQSDPSIILGYLSNGQLSHFLILNDGRWRVTEAPAELVGQPTLLPSLRFVFKNERGRFSFINYLEQVAAGKIDNPSIRLMLDQLAEPIRSIDVAGK